MGGFSADLPLNVLIKQQDVMASSIAKMEKMSTDVVTFSFIMDVMCYFPSRLVLK